MKWHRCMGRRTHELEYGCTNVDTSDVNIRSRVLNRFEELILNFPLKYVECWHVYYVQKKPLEFSSNKNWDFQHGGGGGGEENEEKCCLYSWSSVCYVNLGIWPTMFQVSIENRRTVMRLMHSDRWYQPLVRGTVIGDCSILNYLPHLSSHS